MLPYIRADIGITEIKLEATENEMAATTYTDYVQGI